MAKKKQVAEKEDPLYVGISNPSNIRRNVLESSKDLLGVLKQMEKIKEIRAEKRKNIDALQTAIREIKSLLLKVKKRLPSVSNKVQMPEAPVKLAVPTPKPTKKKEKTEIEKLESELAYIESKLRKA